MKKFLLKLALFTVGLLILFGILSRFVDPYIYGGYEDSVGALHERRPEIILLGDSHAWALKQDAFGNEVFNFSFDSDSLFDMYAKLRYCIEEGIPIRTVLLECDMHIFAAYRLNANNRKRIATFAGYSLYKDAYDAGLLEYVVNRHVYTRWSALDVNNARLLLKVIQGKVAGLGAEQKAETGSSSGGWAELTPGQRRQRSLDRFADQFRTPYAPQFAEVFGRILDLCGRNDIEVIGVRFPISPEYRQVIRTADLTAVEEVYRESGLPIIDLSEEITEPAYYLNQDHLNDAGSERFCARLLEELAALAARPH